MRRTAGCSTAVTLSLAAAGVISAASGCSAGDGFMTSVTLPASDTTAPVSGTQNRAASLAPPTGNGSPPSPLMVTPRQRTYLDALVSGGVHPSSDLLALSIGSYVCQARAAGQNEQAVWDFVHPLVSSDVHDARLRSMTPASDDVDFTTGNYIRIATERLC